MSHHFDAPTAIQDGRLNLGDLYAFPNSVGRSTLVMTANPDAGRSNPTTFRPNALYEFMIASDGGMAWFGLAQDPFWGDAPALFAFTRGLAENQYRPGLFAGTPANLLAGRNVTAIALQVPDDTFGGTEVSIWARISLYGHAPQRQVSRADHLLLRSLFFPQPGLATEALNAASPAGDVASYGDLVQQAALHVAQLSQAASPGEHAAMVAAAFLPDQLRYRPGQPARFAPGSGNGRGLHDDAFGATLSLMVGSPLGVTASPHPVVAEFPHLAPAGQDDLPALADMLGLREHMAKPPAG